MMHLEHGFSRKHRSLLGPLLAVALACGCSACSSETTAGDVDPTPADASDLENGDIEGGSTPAACSPSALADPDATLTYYVAIEEAGASNTDCDGLAPTDEGGGRCPFMDFTSPGVAGLLDQAPGVRVEVRTGTYLITGWEGLRVTGTGTSEAERVVLSAYAGEHPVLDVPRPDGAGCTEQTAPTTPECVREVIRVSGTYTAVQGLTIHNGLGYHAEITGGAHHRFRCNTLGETVAFASRSDCLKIDGGATDVDVRNNEFTQFRSQAIDMTGVSGVLIEQNEFHHPTGDDAGAIGAKFNTRDVIIRDNDIHDLGPSPTVHAFSLGGTSSDHPDAQEATGIVVEGNRVWNVSGIVAQFVSCVDCAVQDNDVWDVGAGLLVSGAGTRLPACTASSTGCSANSGTRVLRNRMKRLNGGGDPAQASTFVVVDPGEGEGFTAADNLYCVPAGDAARFGWEGPFIDFDAWVQAAGTDASSNAVLDTDARCAAF